MKAIINGKLVFPDRIMPGTVLIENDRIIASGNVQIPQDCDVIDAGGLYIGPGFIDQHSHGYQYASEGIMADEDPVAAAWAHLKHGTTTYIPSTDYSDTYEKHLEEIYKCIEAIEKGDTPIAGIHLEGPFINRDYGSESEKGIEYSDEKCDEIFSLAAPYAKHCTYAPELPDARRIEEHLKKYGIRGAIGHSCAGADDIERAVARGARIATHLYDASGCSVSFDKAAERTQHPQDLTADILLAIPGLYYELICDSKGLHATKYSVMKAYRAGGEDSIILISDAIVGDHADENGDVSYDAEGVLTGSRLSIARAARNFRAFTGADIRVTFKCASTNSAKAMGLFDRVGSIDAGKLADIVLVDEDFHVKRVFFRGNEVPEIRD